MQHSKQPSPANPPPCPPSPHPPAGAAELVVAVPADVAQGPLLALGAGRVARGAACQAHPGYLADVKLHRGGAGAPEAGQGLDLAAAEAFRACGAGWAGQRGGRGSGSGSSPQQGSTARVAGGSQAHARSSPLRLTIANRRRGTHPWGRSRTRRHPGCRFRSCTPRSRSGRWWAGCRGRRRQW